MSVWWAVLLHGSVMANPYASAPAAVGVDKDPVSWRVPAAARAPAVEISLTVPDGHAVYRERLAIAVSAEPGGPTVGSIRWPEPRLTTDPSNPERLVALYDPGEIRWSVPVTGSGTLTVTTTHQSCRKGLCYPLKTVEHPVRVEAPVER